MAGERTLPGLGLTGYWNIGDNTWKPGMDVNLLKLSAIVNGIVISRATSLPGSPTQGDVYIVPATDAHGNDLAIYDNSVWTYVTPNVGWLIYVADEAKHYRFEGTGWTEFAPSAGGSAATAAALVSGAAEWQDMSIVNGDFETGDLTGWTTVGSAPTVAATPWGPTDASNGSWVVTGGTSALAEVYQDIVLGAADDSAVLFQVRADLLKDYADSDVSSVKVQVLDGSDATLAENSMTGTSVAPVKEPRSVQVPSMAGQAKLRVTLTLDRNAGTNNNCGLDNISVRRYVLSQYAVPVDYAPYARMSSVGNASSWNISGAPKPAAATVVPDDANGVLSIITEGAVSGVVPMRWENPDKRPTLGSDFDHVFMLDMALSGDFPWAAGVFVENSATSKYSVFGMFSDGRGMRWRWTDTTFDSETEIDGPLDLQPGHWPHRYYARLKRVGPAVQYYVSGNGLSWLKIHEEVLADFVLDVDRIGIFLNLQDQGANTRSYLALLGHDDAGPQPRAVNGASPAVRKATTAASYTVTESDLSGQVIHKLDFAAPGTVTVPPGLLGKEPCRFLWSGPGQPSFVAGAGVTINSASGNLKISAQYGEAILTPDGADTYILTGDLAP